MFKMPNILIKIVKDFLIFFIIILSFLNHSFSHDNNFKINNWIEGIPIFSNLIESKKDVIEFDSSSGKIITITFDDIGLDKKKIYKFYLNYFKKLNWKKIAEKNVWEKEILGLRKKTFKIVSLKDDTLLFKIITENF